MVQKLKVSIVYSTKFLSFGAKIKTVFFFSLLLGSILQFFWCFNFKCSRWNPVLPCLNNLTNPTFATWVVFSIPTLLSSVIVKWLVQWTFSYLSRLQSTTQTSQIGIGTARKKVQKTHSNQKLKTFFQKSDYRHF